MEPQKLWKSLDRQTYRLTWQDGTVWTLTATPGDKYPWMLRNKNGVKQEIGPRDIEAAQAMAEFWLEATALHRAIPHAECVRVTA
jgi:hypothetical protein